MTLRTSFEQTWISFPQGCYLPNINAFRPVVHEKLKIFEDLSKFSLFCPFLNKSESPSPKLVSYHVWLKLSKWFLRRSHSNKSLQMLMTTDGLCWQLNSSQAFGSGELKIGHSCLFSNIFYINFNEK